MRVTGIDTGRGHRWPGTLLALPALCRVGRVRARTASTVPPGTRVALALRARSACPRCRPRPRYCPAAGHGHAAAYRPVLSRHALLLLLHCLGRECVGPALHAARRPAGPVSVDILLAARALGDSLPCRHLGVDVALPLLSGATRRDSAIPRSSSYRSGCADDSPVPLFHSGDVARALTPQTSQAMTSPVSVVPLAATTITFNSS